jgi:hypothetical protein
MVSTLRWSRIGRAIFSSVRHFDCFSHSKSLLTFSSETTFLRKERGLTFRDSLANERINQEGNVGNAQDHDCRDGLFKSCNLGDYEFLGSLVSL